MDTLRKKIYISSILIITVIAVVFVSHGALNASESAKKVKYTEIRAEELINYLKDDSRYEESSRAITTVAINNTYQVDKNGENIYLAKIVSDYFWSSGLLFITVNDEGNITDVKETGLIGLNSLFEYELIDISQGAFIAAYCASHVGNGSLDLVPIDQPDTVKYSIFGAADDDYEFNKMTAVKYGLSKGYDEEGDEIDNLTASAVYLGGKLNAGFADVNEDGNSDIILTGIRQIYKSEGDGSAEDVTLTKEYYIKYVYLFDHIEDDFVFSQNLSQEILITVT